MIVLFLCSDSITAIVQGRHQLCIVMLFTAVACQQKKSDFYVENCEENTKYILEIGCLAMSWSSMFNWI